MNRIVNENSQTITMLKVCTVTYCAYPKMCEK